MRRCSTAVILERFEGRGGVTKPNIQHNFSCDTGEFLVQMGNGHRKRSMQDQLDKTQLRATLATGHIDHHVEGRPFCGIGGVK